MGKNFYFETTETKQTEKKRIFVFLKLTKKTETVEWKMLDNVA